LVSFKIIPKPRKTHIHPGTVSGGQVNPIKLEYDNLTKDTIEINNVVNGIIQYKMNGELLSLNRKDSLSTVESKIDTVFDRNKQRIIMEVNYRTTIKYKATLDLKTMKYLKEQPNKAVKP
jgi:hypothetical protein